MKKTDIVDFKVLKEPIAFGGDKNEIPFNDTLTNEASVEKGFPIITEKPVQEGGLPPFRKDFNGLFYLSTDIRNYIQNGIKISFNQNVSNEIGGYPKDAILSYFDGDDFFLVQSLIDDNTYNFNLDSTYIDGIKWKKIKEKSVPSYDSTLIYNKNDIVNINGIVIKSIIDNNTNDNPINSNNWSYDKAEIISYETKPSISSQVLTIYANTLFSVPNGVDSNGIRKYKLIKLENDLTVNLSSFTETRYIFISATEIYTKKLDMVYVDSSQVSSITDNAPIYSNDTNETYMRTGGTTTQVPFLYIGKTNEANTEFYLEYEKKTIFSDGIIESWGNEENGYEIYISGGKKKCKQWGFVPLAQATTGDQTITLYKQYNNAYYWADYIMTYLNNTNNASYLGIKNKTTNSFTIRKRTYETDVKSSFQWITDGYIN